MLVARVAVCPSEQAVVASLLRQTTLDDGLTGLLTKEDLLVNRNGTRNYLNRVWGSGRLVENNCKEEQLTSDRKKWWALRLMSIRVFQR